MPPVTLMQEAATHAQAMVGADLAALTMEPLG